MPRKDQTGPMSEGARTGRGLGPCGEENTVETGKRNNRRKTRWDGEEKPDRVEFGLRQGNGLKRRGRGRRNNG